MKKLIFSCLVSLMLVLAACQSQPASSVVDLSREDYAQASFVENASLAKQMRIKSFEVDLPNHTEPLTYCLVGNKVYYALDYAPLFYNPLGDRTVPEFSPKYQTELHEYDFEHKRDRFLLKYKEPELKTITALGSNGKELVLVDYELASLTRSFFPKKWHLRLLHLATEAEAEAEPLELAKSSFAEAEEIAINPTVTSEGVYWFAQNAAANASGAPVSFSLNYYEFAGQTKQVKAATCYLENSSEPLAWLDGNYALYKTERYLDNDLKRKNYELEFSHLTLFGTNEQGKLLVPGKVAYPQCNASYCVWGRGLDDRRQLFIYDRQQKQIEKLDLQLAAGNSREASKQLKEYKYYCLVGTYLFVSQPDGLYCYNLQSKEFARLLTIDNDKSGQGISYLGRLKQLGNKLSVEYRDAKSEAKLKVFSVEVAEVKA